MRVLSFCLAGENGDKSEGGDEVTYELRWSPLQLLENQLCAGEKRWPMIWMYAPRNDWERDRPIDLPSSPFSLSSPVPSPFSISRQVIARAEMCLKMTSNTNHPSNCVLREAHNDSSVHVSRSRVCAGSCAARFLSLLPVLYLSYYGSLN